MECPTCGIPELGYEGLHRHLVDEHPDFVTLETKGSRLGYVVSCPLCDDHYRQAIKRGHPDAGFVEEFEDDIRLVGMDILVQHLIGEHPTEVGYDKP